MRNEMIPFEFEGAGVRVIQIDGEPWFVAKDLGAILGLADHKQSTRHLEDDQKGMFTIHTSGGDQRAQIVNEPGLYSLILRSRRPEAKEFKRWVMGEVLPSIRKTGGYAVVEAAAELTGKALLEKALLEANQVLKREALRIVPTDPEGPVILDGDLDHSPE